MNYKSNNGLNSFFDTLLKIDKFTFNSIKEKLENNKTLTDSDLDFIYFCKKIIDKKKGC